MAKPWRTSRERVDVGVAHIGGPREGPVPKRQGYVRRHVGHASRLVVLEDNGAPSRERSDPDYDAYERTRSRKTSLAPEPRPIGHLPNSEKRICPVCERKVRYSLRREEFYSHNAPGSSEACQRSGKPGDGHFPDTPQNQ